MSTQGPIIFISAVSKELHSARALVSQTLTSLGYDPKSQDIAPTETGMLPKVLRDWIDQSDAVIQLVGHCYGFAPKEPDATFGHCSYTQLEALYARQQGKKVYYILTDPAHPTDGCACQPEPEKLHALQQAYRQKIKADSHLYHNTASLDKTELLIWRMQDKLAELRAESQAREDRRDQKADHLINVQQQAMANVAHLHDDQKKHHRSLNLSLIVLMGLVLLSILAAGWYVSLQVENNKKLAAAQAEMQGRLETIKGGSSLELKTSYNDALHIVADKHGIPLDDFRAYLGENADRILKDPAATWKERVGALQSAGKFAEACDFALTQSKKLEAGRQKSKLDEAGLMTAAARIEHTLGHYTTALQYAAQAVSLADRATGFPIWSAARYEQGWDMIRLSQVQQAQTLFEDLIPQQQSTWGPDSLAVLQSRNALAVSIDYQNKPGLAEQQYRALVADYQRVFGPELPDHLTCRMNLAGVLRAQGRYTEAEQMHQEVVQIKERVLGPEHPDTLSSRIGLANALASEGRNVEAEQMYRTVLAVQVRVLGKDHPSVTLSLNNLALCLEALKKLPEALQMMQQVEKTWADTLGPDHQDTKDAKADRERMEDELKKARPQPQ